jgi:hypothetical protein
MSYERPMFPPRAKSQDSTIALRPADDRPEGMLPYASPRPSRGISRRAAAAPLRMIAVDVDELRTLRARAMAYVDQADALKVLLQMVDVTDGLSTRVKADPRYDPVRLSFAASRLGVMIRQFEHSYRRRFAQADQGGAA